MSMGQTAMYDTQDPSNGGGHGAVFKTLFRGRSSFVLIGLKRNIGSLTINMSCKTFLLVVFISVVCGAQFSKDDAISFLTQYGYINSKEANNSLLDLKLYLVEFQERYNLPVDGTLNNKTIQLMQRPRCSQKDINDGGGDDYMVFNDTKWNKTDLTWYFPLAEEPALTVATKAFDIWAKDSKFTFTNVKIPIPKPDITITYRRKNHNFRSSCSGNIKCPSKFDGRGKILAHAYYPYNDRCVEVHLDSDEKWNLSLNMANVPDGETSLLQVLIHELGHTLGLFHSQTESAIMYPWYRDDYSSASLDEDDKLALEALYGPTPERRYQTINPPSSSKHPPTPPPPPPPPQASAPQSSTPPSSTQRTTTPPRSFQGNLCSIKSPDFMFLATASSFPNYRLYIGSGKRLWKLNLDDIKIPQQFDLIQAYLPKEIKTHTITHIFQNAQGDLITYANRRCYAASFPELNIQNDLNLPIPPYAIVNAIFQTNGGQTFVFFDNTSYIEFIDTPQQIRNRGRISDQFPDLPPNITSAFRFTDGYIYFFQQDTYYKFSEYTRKVVAAGPFNWNLFGIPCPTDSVKEQLKTLLSKIISFYE